MKTFKEFLKREEHLKKWENMLHHIAEEELIACKIFSIHLLDEGPQTVIEFRTDCADRPRDLGFQKDLSEKLTLRLKKHILQGLGVIKAKVIHVNYDKR
jgi:hypothetical protein